MTSSGKADIEYIETLFRTYYKELANMAFRVLKDKNAAEDVVQEVFMKLWNNRKELKIKISVKAYLYKSVYHSSLDYLEKWKRLQPAENISSIIKEEIVTEEGLEEKELDDLLNQAMDKLPPKCRVIFCLSRYDGMKYREIAEHLGISIKTVEAQISIALEKLKQELKPFLNNISFWILACSFAYTLLIT